MALAVVVAPNGGKPVGGLQAQDFTLLDNKQPQPVTSFAAHTGSQAPVEIVLVLDAVNADYNEVSYERQQLDRFLKADGGHLSHPVSIAVFTDTGIKLQQSATTDGNALSASLDQYGISLRTIRHSAGFYGATERFQLSVRALRLLAAKEANTPGRKLVLWLSPGWPLLSGPEVKLDGKQASGLFALVVDTSAELAHAHITLYSVNPAGSEEVSFRNFLYQEYLKGVTGPRQVAAGDLSVQVLAVHSGGLALSSSNDIAQLIRQCTRDADAYYEVTFKRATSEKPNEYHQLEVRVDKPGLTARTRQGYYAQQP